MKYLIFTFIILSFTLNCFSQDGSYYLSHYSDYQKIKNETEKVKSIHFNLHVEMIDSFYEKELDFTQFPNLYYFSFVNTYEDSIFEAIVIKKLKMNKNLETLFLQTSFKQDFSGFDSVKTLELYGNAVNNESILAFKNIDYLEFSIDDSCFLTKNSPVFKLKSVKELSIRTKDQEFPYDAISQFENLEIIQLRCDSMQIPDAWKTLKNLKGLDIANGFVKSIPVFFCDMPSFNFFYMYAYSIPDIPLCIFQKKDMDMQINYNHLAKKSELKKFKRYCEKIKKELPNSRFTHVRDYTLLVREKIN
ncbi:MAG: hypothetical protein V4622_13745 [Bacteroidota bacterium]